MSFATLLRPLILVLALQVFGSASCWARSDRKTEVWVSGIVSKITQIEQADAAAGKPGTVTIRLRIDSNGVIESATVEETSGSALLDERALRAAKSAAPFPPPPQKILTLEGFTELAFPLEVGKAR